MKNIITLLIFTFMAFCQLKIYPTPFLSVNIESLETKRDNLSNDVKQLEVTLEKLNRNKRKNYFKVGLSFISSGLVYCLPFAPENFETNANQAFFYAIAVTLVNHFAKFSFYNAFEIRKKIESEISDKRSQIEIIDKLIELLIEKNSCETN